jgi:hypothetical protein
MILKLNKLISLIISLTHWDHRNPPPCPAQPIFHLARLMPWPIVPATNSCRLARCLDLAQFCFPTSHPLSATSIIQNGCHAIAMLLPWWKGGKVIIVAY